VETFTYRGYQVHVVNDTGAWSFIARPKTPDLPILPRPIGGLHISSRPLLQKRRRELIDWWMSRHLSIVAQRNRDSFHLFGEWLAPIKIQTYGT